MITHTDYNAYDSNRTMTGEYPIDNEDYESNLIAELYHFCRTNQIFCKLGVRFDLDEDTYFYSDLTVSHPALNIVVNNFEKVKHRAGFLREEHTSFGKKIKKHIRCEVPVFFCPHHSLLYRTKRVIKNWDNQNFTKLMEMYPSAYKSISKLKSYPGEN